VKNLTGHRTPITVHIVIGPTASGKTAYAIELAGRLNGAVINCDSMQVYDGLPILTAQPTETERGKIPHYLFGVLHPNDACNAARWRVMAIEKINEILAAGKTPIIAGGTGLYVKALTEGLSPIPAIPKNIRDAAIQKQNEMGNPAFHGELQKRDPVMAARLNPNDTQRLIRAWEVFEHTGRSLAAWQTETPDAPPPEWHFEIHKLMPVREELNERINTRFIAMIENGALDEVKAFNDRIDRGEVRPDTPLNVAHGFEYLRRHLQGELSLEEAIDLSQTQSRQYAKRQMTWFRHQL
jgi:tRNA dimethylallyltransferase